MEENKEQILADFQSCTDIEDLGECIMHLEACQWNLLDAINSVMPGEFQTLPSEREPKLSVEVIEASLASAARDLARRSAEVPRSRNSFSDRLNGKYKLHIIDTTNNKEYDLQFLGSKTVREVKSGLRDITKIPVRFQHWIGWPDTLKDDNTKLASLDIPNQALELILSREKTLKPKKPFLDSSSDSENEFEDAAKCVAIDNAFQSTSSSKKIIPRMPEEVQETQQEEVEDEASSGFNFEVGFSNGFNSAGIRFGGWNYNRHYSRHRK